MSNKSNISHYLTKKASEISGLTESLMEVTQDWQIILEFMKNRIETIRLTKKQQAKMQRYQFAYAQASSGRFTDEEVRNLLRAEYTIGHSQAYEDMRCMREIYTVVENPNKRYELMMMLHVNKKLMIKCEEKGELLTVALLEKNRIKILEQLVVEDENPAEDFKGHTYQPLFEPGLISDEVVDMKEVMKIINEKRNVKLDISKISATDIPYEDLDNQDSLQ